MNFRVKSFMETAKGFHFTTYEIFKKIVNISYRSQAFKSEKCHF